MEHINAVGTFGSCGEIPAEQADALDAVVEKTDRYCDAVDDGNQKEADELVEDINKLLKDVEAIAKAKDERVHWRIPVIAWVGTGQKSDGSKTKPTRCYNPFSRNWSPEMAVTEAENLARDKAIVMIYNGDTEGSATGCEVPLALVETLLTNRNLYVFVEDYGTDKNSVPNKIRDLVRRRAQEFGVAVYTDLRTLADDVIDSMSEWETVPASFPTVANEDDIVECVINGTDEDLFKLAEIGWTYLDCLKNGRRFRLTMEKYQGNPKSEYGRAWKIVKAHAEKCAEAFGLDFQFIA